MNAPKSSRGLGGPLVTIGAVVAMLACCLGPALIAAGVFTAAGTALRTWWPVAAAALVLLGALAYTARHRRRQAECCPPNPTTSEPRIDRETS